MVLLLAIFVWAFSPHIHWVTPRGRQSVTQADLRAYSEALREFHDEGGAYPVTDSTFADFGTAIGSRLVDEGYLREVAMEPWGGTFGYWSDGSHVVVASTGPNQRFDLEYGVLAQVHAVSQLEQLCAAMSPSNDDYVFIDGNECPQDI